MEIRSMGMDVISENGFRYNIRISQEAGSKELELTVFEGFAGAVQMHVDSLPVSRFFADFDNRRLFNKRTGVLLPVDVFGIVKAWVRVIWDLTR